MYEHKFSEKRQHHSASKNIMHTHTHLIISYKIYYLYIENTVKCIQCSLQKYILCTLCIVVYPPITLLYYVGICDITKSQSQVLYILYNTYTRYQCGENVKNKRNKIKTQKKIRRHKSGLYSVPAHKTGHSDWLIYPRKKYGNGMLMFFSYLQHF